MNEIYQMDYLHSNNGKIIVLSLKKKKLIKG